MDTTVWSFIFGIFVVACRVKLTRSAVLESIYWNSSNTKFVPGKGVVLYPQIGDKMDIVCPRIKPGSTEQTNIEYFRVYLVPKEQLETCRVTKSDMLLLNCDKPDQDVKFTFKFQEFSPNLWGLEFFKGKDYHIISTSNSTFEGLDNHDGGVCKTKSMKLILKFGQSPTDSFSAKNHPTRYPPKYPDNKDQNTFSTEKDMVSRVDPMQNGEAGGESGETVGSSGSEVALFAGIASGAVIFIIIIIALVALLNRRHQKHSAQCSAQLPLNTLPKRGSAASGGSNNNSSEPSDIIFPLRTSGSMYCPHYEKVSGDYGHPVYIVQEMPPQNPANIYYKV
ncbi:ephrin-B2a-like [Carassius auratus]|uniref:Ephrin-B2a-like n=1 Tax=Carassius auratus TaxID=7957 RepID=A0A6P6PM14_CARAU|nr:ephrin-B2a-like [Carassius auratus]